MCICPVPLLSLSRFKSLRFLLHGNVCGQRGCISGLHLSACPLLREAVPHSSCLKSFSTPVSLSLYNYNAHTHLCLSCSAPLEQAPHEHQERIVVQGPGSQLVSDEYLPREPGDLGQVTASVPALLSEAFKLDILSFFCLELECGSGVQFSSVQSLNHVQLFAIP